MTEIKDQQSKVDVIKEMEPYVGKQLHLLKAIDKCWQPDDLLPDLRTEDWQDQILEFRKGSDQISDELFAVLIGNMITEEALPSYESWITNLEGIGHHGGTSDSPWARWSRGWTAEENRHGDVLKTYLYLTGRVDMHVIEVTIQHLIKNGFDPLTGNDPYYGLVYTSVQERATAISHKNTAKLAEQCGDPVLAKMCQQISGDESRHEQAYKLFFKKVLELDPSTALQAFETMMNKKVIMPAQTMEDGTHNLFAQHVQVCQRMKIYTTQDYANVMAHLVQFWEIDNLKGLTSEGTKAQEFICELPKRYLKRADRMANLVAKRPKTPCPWLFDRAI